MANTVIARSFSSLENDRRHLHEAKGKQYIRHELISDLKLFSINFPRTVSPKCRGSCENSMIYNCKVLPRNGTSRCDWILCIIFITIVLLVSSARGDVFCGTNNPTTDSHVTYCYGVTAYCCGYHEDRCCWDSIWKVWWFWVVVLVVLGALFSCIGYFCTCMNDEWAGNGRVSPIYAIRDGFRRRFSSTQGSVETDPYKDYRERTVLLPPYYPTTSTVPVGGSPAASYPDAPPPYTEQPATEHSNLLPVSTTTSVVNSEQFAASTTAQSYHATQPRR